MNLHCPQNIVTLKQLVSQKSMYEWSSNQPSFIQDNVLSAHIMSQINLHLQIGINEYSCEVRLIMDKLARIVIVVKKFLTLYSRL